MNGAFTFDTNKCTGCGACRVACTIENGLAPDVSWRRIDTFNPQRRPTAPVFHVSLACNHCATAACMNACPALAYRRDTSTKAVLLDSSLCIGCGYCSWACPYDAPVFDETAGVMTKCTWCADRLRAGLAPACASHCPTGALGYADIAPGARVSTMAGLPATDLGPSLHVVPLEPGRMQPLMATGDDPLDAEPAVPGRRRISLRREWPLAVFTYGASLLVGVAAGAAAGVFAVPAWSFALLAAVVMGTAGMHLGRKERGWRAVLNVRRSWLSREIVVLSTFVAAAVAWLATAPAQAAFGSAVTFVGIAGLMCADRVYAVLPGGGKLHSASVTLTGALLAAALAGLPLGAGLILAVKASLYFRASESRRLPPVVSAARVGFGFVAPVALWLLGHTHAAPLACILVGEAIGRCEYYLQLGAPAAARAPGRVSAWT